MSGHWIPWQIPHCSGTQTCLLSDASRGWLAVNSGLIILLGPPAHFSIRMVAAFLPTFPVNIRVDHSRNLRSHRLMPVRNRAQLLTANFIDDYVKFRLDSLGASRSVDLCCCEDSRNSCANHSLWRDSYSLVTRTKAEITVSPMLALIEGTGPRLLQNFQNDSVLQRLDRSSGTF
jgi:hypothetical protein